MLVVKKFRWNKIFRVFYRTAYGKGGIRVDVSNFFGNSTLTNTNNLLKLAKIHCTEDQRIALLADLKEEKLLRRGTERKRIERCIEKIKVQKWGQRSTSC